MATPTVDMDEHWTDATIRTKKVVQQPLLLSHGASLHRWIAPEAKVSELPVGEAQDRAGALTLASYVSKALMANAHDAISEAISSFRELVPSVRQAHFFELTHDGREAFLRLRASSSPKAEQLRIELPVNEGVLGDVACSGEPAIELDASTHRAYSHQLDPPLLGRSPIICLAVGLESVETLEDIDLASPAGVLLLTGSFGCRFSQLDVQLTSTVVAVMNCRRQVRQSCSISKASPADADTAHGNEERGEGLSERRLSERRLSGIQRERSGSVVERQQVSALDR